MPKSFVLPVPSHCVVTQTWEQHKERATQMGCAWKPGMNAKCWYYPGVDLAPTWAFKGDVPVYAAADGRVIKAGPDNPDLSRGYGVHVRIQHPDGDLTIYGHLEDGSLKVKDGDTVKAGQRIGTMGNTGYSTGRHLHWEWRKAGLPTDPWPLVNSQPVEPAPEPTPEPEPEQPEPLVIIPPLPKVRVLEGPLTIRQEPGRSGRVLGYLQVLDEVEVMGIQKSGSDVWLCIGYKQFIAMQVGGVRFVRWV